MACFRSFVAGYRARGIERARPAHHRHNVPEAGHFAVLNGMTNEVALGRFAAGNRQ